MPHGAEADAKSSLWQLHPVCHRHDTGLQRLLECRPEHRLHAQNDFPWRTFDARDIASLVSCGVVSMCTRLVTLWLLMPHAHIMRMQLSALATSAGIGGMPGPLLCLGLGTQSWHV